MVGKRIKARRMELDLTQMNLAELAGVAPAQISRWESGAVVPALGSLGKIARALGVGIDDLISVED